MKQNRNILPSAGQRGDIRPSPGEGAAERGLLVKRATNGLRWALRETAGHLRPWHLVTLVVLFYVLLTLSRHNWDPMSFVIVGGVFDPQIPNDSLGYDGQFAYQIARRPLEGWRYTDVPSYRYQRILYPLAARLLSLGIPALVPWSLILINLVALPVGTALTEAILVRHDTARWYALTYGLHVGLLMPVRLDLTEPLAYLLVQAGVLAFSKDHRQVSGLAFALSALTREVTLLFPLGYFCYLLSQRRWRPALTWVSIPVLPFLGWQTALRLWLGEWGVGSGGALSTPFEWVPFRGWWRMAFYDVQAFVLMSLLIVPLALAPALLSFSAAGLSLVKGKGSPAAWALLANAAIFPFLPSSNVLDPLGLSRITAGLAVATLNVGAAERNRRVLNYAMLWILTVVFLYQDSLLPCS